MYLPLIILFLYFSIFHIKSEYLFHKNDILFTFIVDTEHSIKLRVFVPFFYSENAFSDKLRCQEGETADFIVQFPPLTIRYFTFYKYLMVPGTFYLFMVCIIDRLQLFYSCSKSAADSGCHDK